ncbi:hypothetical protein [Runella sp.]|uniref:hypothetical protein n=1 Tax=Runella sp. TaxID=1960881 RepID=UPI003D0E7C39
MQLSPNILPLWQSSPANKPAGLLRRTPRKRLSLQAQAELIAVIKDSAVQDTLVIAVRAEELLGEKTLADHHIFLHGNHRLSLCTDSTVILCGTARLYLEVQGEAQVTLKASGEANFHLEASQHARVSVLPAEHTEGIVETWDTAQIIVDLSGEARATVDTFNEARAVITAHDCTWCDVNAVDNAQVMACLSPDCRFTGEKTGNAQIIAIVQ